VTDKKELEDTFQQAFESGEETLPGDKYFQKIWTSIESRAPVGEKYYLRSFLSIFFILLFFTVFILFYTDFLSSVLTLKEVRKENTAFSSPVHTSALSPYSWTDAKEYKQKEVAPGITIQSLEKTSIRLLKVTPQQVELEFLTGHAVVVTKPNDINRNVIIYLPDLTMAFKEGRFNIFCYDSIIRIIPLTHPASATRGDITQQLEPGETFYLLDKKTIKH
jgi:hypothetical protein